MPTVNIYYLQSLRYADKFWRDFYVLEDSKSGELYWVKDEQRAKPGVLKTWIQLGDTHPQILGILPEWQLIIDGVLQPMKFYDVVEGLDGKLVEITYQDYQFVFDFSKS